MNKIFMLSALLLSAFLISTSAEAKGQKRGSLRKEGKLKAGDVAPEISLKSPDGKTSFSLASFKNKKPVVLIFGSYT